MNIKLLIGLGLCLGVLLGSLSYNWISLPNKVNRVDLKNLRETSDENTLEVNKLPTLPEVENMIKTRPPTLVEYESLKRELKDMQKTLTALSQRLTTLEQRSAKENIL